MTDLVLTLPMPPAELSPNSRCHWKVRSQARKQYQRDCYYALFAQIGRVIPRFPRASLMVTFVYRTMQRRDIDNALASVKSGLDAIVRYGLLPDDSADHLPEVTVRREIQPDADPHVRVHLTELDEPCNAPSGGATSLKH